MSEQHFDEYERYNFEVEKYIHAGHSGKQRSKKEAAEHTNHFDPCGHSRKIVEKLINTEKKRKKSNSTSSNGSQSTGDADSAETVAKTET